MRQTVRALAGEADEVGSKAIALLEDWKQLVSVRLPRNFDLISFHQVLKIPQVMTEGGAETLTPPEPEAWNEGAVTSFCLGKLGGSFELLATSINWFSNSS